MLIHKQYKNYSKGAQGLFVLLQKLRIFTKNSNSLRSQWRQWRSRYAIQQVGTYPTNDFATLGPSELQPPFTWVYNQSVNSSILPLSTGQASDPIHHVTIQQSPVFLLNSRPSLFYVTSRALLFPKLQSQIAEFLHYDSLMRFSTFIPIYQLQFEYGFIKKKLFLKVNKYIKKKRYYLYKLNQVIIFKRVIRTFYSLNKAFAFFLETG